MAAAAAAAEAGLSWHPVLWYGANAMNAMEGAGSGGGGGGLGGVWCGGRRRRRQRGGSGGLGGDGGTPVHSYYRYVQSCICPNLTAGFGPTTAQLVEILASSGLVVSRLNDQL